VCVCVCVCVCVSLYVCFATPGGVFQIIENPSLKVSRKSQ
jgi:hypothetical protein